MMEGHPGPAETLGIGVKEQSRKPVYKNIQKKIKQLINLIEIPQKRCRTVYNLSEVSSLCSVCIL